MSGFLHHPTPHLMALRQNPRNKVIATSSSTPASFFLSQRPLAGGEDRKLIHNFKNCYRQLQAVKDDIVEAGDSQSAKEYVGKLGTCLVRVSFLVEILLLIISLTDVYV